jgi:alkylhydroperoxidase family enzyme
VSIENPQESGPRVEPKDPETVAKILEDAPDAAKANMERAEAILGALEDGELPEKYDAKEDWGFTFTGILAHHPETFKIWWAEEGQVFSGGNLPRDLKELMGAVIAHEKGAEICIAWHSTSAKLEDIEPERYAVAGDFENRKNELSDDVRAAIEFGLKSVTEPHSVTNEDFEKLRELGYSDADIVEIATAAGTAAKFANYAITFDI